MRLSPLAAIAALFNILREDPGTLIVIVAVLACLAV